MNIRGFIKSQKKIIIDNDECYGCTYAYRNRFSIRIAEETGKDFYLFADTVLHELIHLWIFILSACTNVKITDNQSHRIINKVMPRALKMVREYYHKGKRK